MTTKCRFGNPKSEIGYKVMWVQNLGRKENQNYEISHIGRTSQDPRVYKQIQNSLFHIAVCGAQGDLSRTIHVDVQGGSAWVHCDGDLLEISFWTNGQIYTSSRARGFWTDSESGPVVRLVGRTTDVTKKPCKIINKFVYESNGNHVSHVSHALYACLVPSHVLYGWRNL